MIGLLLAAITTLLLFGTLVDFLVGHRRLRRLGHVAPAPPFPSVSVVVAARNEGRHIERAATSLTALDYPRLEIIIVDDRSTDETGAILDRLSARHPNLRVTHVSELPPGWLGKNHALFVGASEASGELLLFTDADVVFEPTALKRAVTLMRQEGLDHLAAIPHAVAPGFALGAAVAAFGVFFAVYTRPWKVGDPKSPRHIGIGAFNLLRSSAYRAAGTHRAIALRPDDDVKLGKVVKKAGFRQGIVVAHDLITVEWYATLREFVDGLMKNAFAGVDYSLLTVAGSTIALTLTNVWPFIAVFVTSGAARTLNIASVVCLLLIFWTSARGVGSRPIYAVAYPASALLLVYIMWRSALMALVRGQIVWRGTAYPLSELKANRV
jgi:glycosyltransferase involved in cell wall biosynthesis